MNVKPEDRTQVWDGKPYIIHKDEMQDDACCDCGLVHRTTFEPQERGDIICTTARHSASTRLQRRAKDCALLDGTSKTHVMITKAEYRLFMRLVAQEVGDE